MEAFEGGLEKLIYEFEHPSAEFSPMPFWFWNDTLTEAEISRQMQEFKQKGVDGFVIHPRLGLDPDIPYMGKRWLHFVRYAVNLAKALDMRVILYDEAMYPSGSCCGRVVAENRDFAAKGLRMSASSELLPDERLVAVTEWQGERRYFILTPTGGTIRGVYYGQDDNEPNAPPAADLLSFDAVAAFIRLTHEEYYAALSEHFGNTVVAFFTDEPSLTGRCAKSDIIPWTADFLADFEKAGFSVAELPALFDRDFPDADKIREGYWETIFERMNRSYYGQIADWCKAHGILLAGHPAESDDIHLLSHFGIPCQDIVWRYVAPKEPTNICGRHSTMGKCASDSARHRGKRRNGNECFGVCGHRDDPYAFDRSDMKWYLDWLFARGCNLIIPHAFYYSLRGARRDERPPEVGMHSPFWSEYRELSNYVKRCSAINTDGYNLTDVAILCTERHLPDLPARSLYENQIEFNYLERELISDAKIKNGTLCLLNQAYRVIITEGETDEKTSAALTEYVKAGITVIDYREFENNEREYLSKIRRASRTVTDIDNHPDLRLSRIVKHGVALLFLSNEGEEVITVRLRERVLEIWDSESGARTPHTGDGLDVRLAPRKSLHLVLG